MRARSGADKEFVDDEALDVRVDGYPPEVGDAIKKGKEWAKMNPENVFVLQDIKEGWMRYAVPLVATCLPALAKKSLISKYEDAILNLGIHSFVHAKYGYETTDHRDDYIPERGEIQQIYSLIQRAMTGGAIAVTNPYVKIEVIQPDTKLIFQEAKYSEVNAELLSAGGLSSAVVSGSGDNGSTYGVAKVSMQIAALRIKQTQDNFCAMMNKINARLNGVLPRTSQNNVPKFKFYPVDLAGNDKFLETCRTLYTMGVLSKETLLDFHGVDGKQEEARIAKEPARDDVAVKNNEGGSGGDGNNGKIGRPEMSDMERSSDIEDSMSGKQPKPSNEEGSM